MENNEVNNQDLASQFGNFQIANALALGDIRSDIKVLTAEVKHLSDTLAANTKAQATKEEVQSSRAQSIDEHKALSLRINALENWNTWFIRIVLSAVILAVMGAVLVVKA